METVISNEAVAVPSPGSAYASMPAQHQTSVYRNGQVEVSAIYGNGLSQSSPFMEMVPTEILQDQGWEKWPS